MTQQISSSVQSMTCIRLLASCQSVRNLPQMLLFFSSLGTGPKGNPLKDFFLKKKIKIKNLVLMHSKPDLCMMIFIGLISFSCHLARVSSQGHSYNFNMMGNHASFIVGNRKNRNFFLYALAKAHKVALL